MKKIKRHLLPAIGIVILAFAGMMSCSKGTSENPGGSGGLSGGSVKLNVASIASVSSVDVTISGGGLTTPIHKALLKAPGSDYYQGLFQNIPAGDHYTVSVSASTATSAYLGLKEELTVLAGQTTDVTIYLQKQGSIDLTAPIISSITFVTASGHDYFNVNEAGTFIVATRFADSFTWTAASGTFAANNLSTVQYAAGALGGTDTVSVSVKNSLNGKTAQASVSFSVRDPNDGAIDVTVYFVPEIIDVTANPGSFKNLAGETMVLSSITDPDISVSTGFGLEWSTTCNGITLNNGSSGPTFSFSFTGANASPMDCLASVSLKAKDASNALIGLPFSTVIYRLAYMPPATELEQCSTTEHITVSGLTAADVAPVITGTGWICVVNNGGHVAATETGPGTIKVINNGAAVAATLTSTAPSGKLSIVNNGGVMTATNTGNGVMDIISNATGAVTVTNTGNGKVTVNATGAAAITVTHTGDDDITYPSSELNICTDTTTLVAGGTMGNVCSTAAFTSGAPSTVNGYVSAVAAVTLGANSTVTSYVTAGAGFTSGDTSVVGGNVTAGAAYTSGANSIVYGDVSAAGAVTLGANSRIYGSVHSGTGVITYGAGATVGSVVTGGELEICTDTTTLAAGGSMGSVCSTAAFTSGAPSTVNGYVTATAAVTIGANGVVSKYVTAGAAFTSGDTSSIGGNVTAGAAYTSGANSIVYGNVSAAGAVTLGANSRIYGSVHSGTGVITYGAGAIVGSVR